LLACLLVTSVLATPPDQNARPTSLVLTHVTVIDGSGSPPQPGMTVVITGERITGLGQAGTIPIPTDAQVVDAMGKFLIPGLWDMHAHPFLTKHEFYPQFVMNLYLANGVTGLRDMFGPIEEEKQWLKATQVGTTLGPRMIMAGPLHDGPKSIVPGATVVTNETEARKAVLAAKRRGADFVKVYERLSRAAYVAIADEAKRQNLPYAGHIPAALTAAEASDIGQKSIEHLSNVVIACSHEAAELQKVWSKALLEPDGATSQRDLTRAETRALETLDEDRCRALAARFAHNGTWLDPTLVVLRAVAFGNDRSLTDDPRLRYIPRTIRDTWRPANHDLWKKFTAEDFTRAQRVFPRFLEIVRIMHHATVKLLAGTDPPVPYCLPGFSVHDELALFVSAGLTPMEALQTATRNPAQYVGLLESLGTVEEGKIADLVLLGANPADDIRNTQSVYAVVLNGKFLPEALLLRMLAEVQAASNM
jgi:imidazolonepropionase-like amidohydrolase